MRQLTSCGVLIVRGDPIDSFLLMVHPTRYDLPKGHVDDGESEIECALRELWEETGISPDDLELDKKFRFVTSYEVQPKKLQYETCNKTLVVFLGRLKHDVKIVPTEHIGYEWFPWQPPHRIQSQTIDQVLAQAEAHIRCQQV